MSNRVATNPVPAFCEPLESRRLLSTITQVTDLGTLAGRKYLSGEFLSKNTPSAHQNAYQFHLSRSAHLDIQLSRLNGFVGEDCDIFFENINGVVAQATKIGSADEVLSRDEPAGDYAVRVVNANGDTDAHYTLAIASDFAGFEASSAGVDGSVGRDFGTLLDGSTNSASDFVGYLDGSDRAAQDLDDMVFFKIPAPGHVKITVNKFAADPNGAPIHIEGEFFQDFGNDGTFTPGVDVITNGDVDLFDVDKPSQILQYERKNLSAGQFALKISQNVEGPDILHLGGGSNYTITITYSATDAAGNSQAAARDIGSLDNPTRTFSDFLGPNDTVDFYKFTTVGNGPFRFEPQLTDVSSGASFLMDVIRASDNATIASGIQPEQDDAIGLTAPGSYFVKIRHVSGEGAYTLSLSNHNLDLAGNSLAGANNLLTLDGNRHLGDTVSPTDQDDFFKFSTSIGGTVSASMAATATGTDADITLLNSSGITIRSATVRGSGAEFLSTPLASGTYFLLVHRVAGTPAYSVDLQLDTGGNNSNTALTLTPPDGAHDFVGPSDPKDTFKLTLPHQERLGADLLFVTDPINIAIGKDTNNNLVLDASEKLVNRTVTDSHTTTLANLLPGNYLIEVTSAGTLGTNYLMGLGTAPLDIAGNTAADAKDIGAISSTRIFSDFVGNGSGGLFMADNDDFYKFTFADNGKFNFTASLTGLSGDANIRIFRDDNGNQQLDQRDGELIGLGTNTGTTSETITLNQIQIPGTYYLQVFRASNLVSAASYTLTVSATSTDTAGNTFDTANDLGTLGNGRLLSGFVGQIDPVDVYRFVAGGPTELTALFGSDLPLPVSIQVLRGDGQQLMASSGDSPRGNDLLNGIVLAVGDDYEVRVVSNGVDTSYGLILAPSVQNPFPTTTPPPINTRGTTRIEAENFDNGGEGVAYHDTDPADGPSVGVNFRSNEGVDIRNTSDTGGGFRLATTKAGEFLEYTVVVQEDGNYDFDFRVSSPLDNATFHLESDGVDVTGPMVIPNTGSVDNMTTITKASVPLITGPHIFRLVMDQQTGGNPDIAGTYNFIEVRPSPPGKFALHSDQISLDSHGHAIIALDWTVPVGGWRILKDVQLRLLDGTDVLSVLKFDEASNTIAFVHPNTGKAGPGKTPGGNGTLNSNGVTLHLAGSSVQASGPTSPTVTIVFDLTFKKALLGKDLILEAAAGDDNGRSADWEFGGLLQT